LHCIVLSAKIFSSYGNTVVIAVLCCLHPVIRRYDATGVQTSSVTVGASPRRVPPGIIRFIIRSGIRQRTPDARLLMQTGHH